MAETFNKNDLYNSAQNNFKKLLEVAFSSDIKPGQPLDDPQILQRLHEMTNSINEPLDNSYIVPQLFRDCSEGNYDEVKNHIINRCDVNEIGPDGETALACAINANNFQIVELLLKSGGNPNSRPDKIESTPLMDAANVGYTDIVRILLESGANPDVKSATNNTSLHYAACGGHLECCKLMLEYSSNPQALIEEQNENGHTALMEAATSGFLDTTKFLVQNGAQINTPSAEFKETALTLASYKGYSDIVQFLLEAGADHEHRTDEMHTALMEAAMEGHIDAAKVLLYYGAQVNMRPDSFESPLTLAACSGHTELAAHLISYGADIEEVNDESYTPLMEAAREGHLDTVVMLLALGANINRVTEETQETAMTLAACGGFYDIVLLLQRCGADIELGASTPLMESAQEGHLDIVKALLVMGAKVDAKNSSDETSLHFAAENGHVEVCRYLLEHNADIHHVSEGGRTCLMKACRAGNLEVVFLLIDRGSRIDQLTNSGDHNALSLACANGHCKVVEYLLQIGADPTVKLKDSSTVLIEASRAGHIDVIEILLRDNRRDKRQVMTTSNSAIEEQHMYPMGSIDHDNVGSSQQLNNHYLSSTTTTTMDTKTMHGTQDHFYGTNKFMNIPVGMRLQPQQSATGPSCDYSGIYNGHHILSPNSGSQFHSCAFPNSFTSDSLPVSLQLLTDASSHDNMATFVRPLILPTEIPDPPSNPPPLPPLVSLGYNQSSNPTSLYSGLQDDVSLPLSIFGADNDKLLQNILDPNSPNLEEWVKYMYPSFNNNVYTGNNQSYESPSSGSIQLSQSELACVTSQQQANSNGHFHRKIKKAKHSENYNSQFDSIPNKTCIYNCQHQLASNFFADKLGSVDSTAASTTDTAISANCKFHRCPAEGADEPRNASMSQQQNSSLADNNDSEPETNHQCKDCNKYQVTNTSSDNLKNAFTYPGSTNKNLFSATTSNTSLVHRHPAESGIFSGRLCPPDDYHQTDIKRIFNSVTPTSTSPLKPITASTPFQKQVLQPKRRLQQSQRSPLSTSMSLSSSSSSVSASSSLCSEHRMKLSGAPPMSSDSFSLQQQYLASTDPLSNIHNYNFPEKNLSLEERDLFFQQSMLGEYVVHECHGKYRGLAKMTNGMDLSVCDNIGSRRPQAQTTMVAVSGNNSAENLEVVEEDNEDNDEDDEEDEDDEDDNEDDDDEFDSDMEMGQCAGSGATMTSVTAPPYSGNMQNTCCNKLNCKRKLNVNVCTESSQESPLSLACSGGHIEVVKLLINNGAKLEHRDKKSQTALHVAVLNGHLEVVRFLLEAGADMEAMVDRTKDTALSIACANGKAEIIEDLVKKGAFIEHRNISDYTPLCLAASGGYVEVIKFLLKNGAEINSRTNSKLGISPLMLAAMNGHLEAVSVLLDNGSDINAQIETNRNTALTLACFQGRTDVVSLLVDKKAYIEHRAKSGLTPLMEAASQGHVDVGRILISAGADVNAPPVPASRETALIIASEKGHTEFVKLLLQNNAIVDARNKKGDTPLWLASNGGYIEVVRVLIDAMSDANSADNRRMTCLMAAFKKGHVKVVKELVKYVTQFPSEHDCMKHMKSIKNEDKDLIKRCEACKEIILKAKERQEYEAARNAKDLLKQVEEERKAKEQKEVKQAKKREKKKAKKKAKHEDKDVDTSKSDDKNCEEDLVVVVEEPPRVPRETNVTESKQVPAHANLSTHNNNVNNPTDTVVVHIQPVKSNKRSRTKQESDKNKAARAIEDKSTAVTVLKEDVISVTVDQGTNSGSNTNRTTVPISTNECPKTAMRNNCWIQISSSSSKLSYTATKTDDNSWQKIGGNKKKLDIQVNKKDIGKVIGQGGSVVNAIRHITGAHIDIDSVANEMDERTVHVKGSLEAVTRARDYIWALVEGTITGNTVIKDSEPYVSSSSTTTSKATQSATVTATNVALTTANAEQDYAIKSPHKPLPIVRQNGKLNKFGYSKFGVATNSLQYGFSKSMIKCPDFASVAAAGIVSTKLAPHAPISQPLASLKVSSVDNNVSKDQPPTSMSSPMDPSFLTSNVSHHHNEPLEVNTNILSSQTNSTVPNNGSMISSKSFPLAPGSERSLHQRTYNSTPEHSPQIDHSNTTIKTEMLPSSSNHSPVTSSGTSECKEDLLLESVNCYPLATTTGTCTGNVIINHNSWPFPHDSYSSASSSLSAPINDPTDVMNRFPKLQSLNPKAEAFSPSFIGGAGSNSNNLYNFKPEDFYYNINGTLSLNPTANIFKPRQMSYQQQQSVKTGNNNGNPFCISAPPTIPQQQQAAPTLPQQPQEERLIRLQDHINMAINILLRTNGFDHNMAEAAFTSFMRSANLDLNTRLTTAEFTSLINNIISQSNGPPAPPQPSHHPQASHHPQPAPSLAQSSTSSQVSPSSNYLSPAQQTAQAHWPLISNLGSQSIWAPAGVSNGVLAANNSPFFPNLSQCVSAQAAFNSPLTSLSFPGQMLHHVASQPQQSLVTQQPPLQHPSSSNDMTNNNNSSSYHLLLHHNHQTQKLSDRNIVSNGSPVPSCFDQKEV